MRVDEVLHLRRIVHPMILVILLREDVEGSAVRQGKEHDIRIVEATCGEDRHPEVLCELPRDGIEPIHDPIICCGDVLARIISRSGHRDETLAPRDVSCTHTGNEVLVGRASGFLGWAAGKKPGRRT